MNEEIIRGYTWLLMSDMPGFVLLSRLCPLSLRKENAWIAVAMISQYDMIFIMLKCI